MTLTFGFAPDVDDDHARQFVARVTAYLAGRGKPPDVLAEPGAGDHLTTIDRAAVDGLLEREAHRRRDEVEDRHRQQERDDAWRRVQADPWLWQAFTPTSAERTACRYAYKLAREHEAVPDADIVARGLDDSGVRHLFPPFDWAGAVARAVAGCRAWYKAPQRTHPLGMFLRHLRRLIPPERLAESPVALTYADLDIALIYYTLQIGGKRRDRQVGHCGSNVLPAWFKGCKPKTGRGCGKQKALVLHRLMLEFGLIRVFDSSYHPKKYRKAYAFGPNHPEYRGRPTGWASVPASYKHKSTGFG
jgi:hypothetical protein